MKDYEYFLAVDIGASSGRHILGNINSDNKIEIEEVYRFNNQLINKDSHLCWDLNYLFSEILNGLKKCKSINKIPSYLAIDTWGVDFVLLDENNELVGDSVSYRDKRTHNIIDEVYSLISKEDLYKKTGIQNLVFNTIYQLYSIKKESKNYFQKAKYFLMIPDYFNFLLTGNKFNEHTNASTTQLVNIEKSNWDYDILKTLEIPNNIFQEIIEPGTHIGFLRKEIKEKIGFDLEVISAPSHDTASAILSVPSIDDNFLYISSGTWSLLGSELKEYNNSIESFKLNFTNEAGYNNTYRYLKNIMGSWIIQNIKKELNNKYSFSELSEMAEKTNTNIIIDVNDDLFLSPSSMIDSIKKYCIDNFKYEPKNINEITSIVYNSLAKSYSNTIKDIKTILNKEINNIFIIGGGSKDNYLNSLTAKESGLNVFSGPIEATSTGNIICQMLNKNIFSSVKEARKSIFNSFSINKI